jgi:hypothetical protein
MTSRSSKPTSRHLVEGIDGAKLYRKRIIDVEVRFAQQAGFIATLEGAVACSPGDALVTGTRGEIWPVTRCAFEQKYEAIPPTIMGSCGRYRTRATAALALRLTGPVNLALPSGKGILQGHAGDWLVQYGEGDQSLVNSLIFEETYEVTDCDRISHRP